MSEKTTVKKTSSNKVESKEPIKQLIYCGPSLKDLQQYSIFRGEPPEHVKKHMGKSTAVKALVVSVEEFAVVRKNILTQGTRENQFYLKALEYTKGGNK